MNMLWAFNFNLAKDPATGLTIPVDADNTTDVRFFSVAHSYMLTCCKGHFVDTEAICLRHHTAEGSESRNYPESDEGGATNF